MLRFILLLLLAPVCLISCNSIGGTSDLEKRVVALEKQVAEDQKFIEQAKKVLAEHRAHILESEKRFQILSNPRYQPKNLQKPSKK